MFRPTLPLVILIHAFLHCYSFPGKIVMEIKTATKKDGGYKQGSFYLKGPFCKTLQTLAGEVYDTILEAAGTDNCPIPGPLAVDGFYLDSNKLNDQILYGEIRANIRLLVKEEVKGCYMMYMNLVPKEE